MNARTTRFLLVRHGETDWNRRPRFRGRVDVPLNRQGVRQAELAGTRLARLRLAAVYASPLARTMCTARAVADRHDLPVVPHPGLIDMCFGAWEGRTPVAVGRADPARFRRWQTAPSTVEITDGETLDDVQQRALATLRALARRHRRTTVAIVSHDVVGRVLLCAALGLELDAFRRVPQDNAAVSVLDLEGRTLSAVSINDTTHLDPTFGSP